MTWIDPPESYRLTVRDIPPRVFSDFKQTCTRRRLPVNTAIIGLMELCARTNGRCLEDHPVE